MSELKFNKKTLKYEKSNRSQKEKIVRNSFSILISAFVVAFIIFLMMTYFFDSPQKRKLKREHKILEQQYKILLKKRIIIFI